MAKKILAGDYSGISPNFEPGELEALTSGAWRQQRLDGSSSQNLGVR